MKVALLLVGLALATGGSRGLAREPDEVARGWRVPLERRTPEVEEADAAFKRVTGDLPGKAGIKPETLLAPDGEFVLRGDLFGPGGCFALVELSPQRRAGGPGGFFLAEWSGSVWWARQWWDLPVTWRAAGWKEGGDDYLPTTPASEPFILRDFDDDGRPEVIVAGEVAKYFQVNYLLRFNPKTRGLSVVGCGYEPPVKRGPFVVFYSNSGRRSIYEDWDFCRWRDRELESVASWHEETPYNNIDPSFSEATLPRPGGIEEVIRVSQTDLQPEFGFVAWPRPEWESVYLVTTARQPFGTLRITWKPWDWTARLSGGGIWVAEQAWLFERLTGLPRDLYPAGREGWEPVERLEDFATVDFSGDPVWAGRLSTSRAGK